MAPFIITGNSTAAAMKGLLAKPSDREAAPAALVAAAGGKLLAYDKTTGDTDFHMINETDNQIDMMAALIVAGASGAVAGPKTVPAFSSAEFMVAQKRAGEVAQTYAVPA